ncbi:translation initiation factor IF-3 [soil metagenome]|nr:translation initiation factor IF-3 [Gemmatimonadota bacterium]
MPPGSDTIERRSFPRERSSWYGRTWNPGPPFFIPFFRRALAINEKTRVNHQIRISPVRVIAPDGEQLGILPVDRALEIAEQQGLDLVEVAPTARPPVCRIMDYGKFKYEEQRKAREARKKQHHVQVKEVKMRPGIEDHDFEFKTRHARRFLEEGNKVKVTMMFRGRQMAHPELGRQVLTRVADEVSDLAKVESHPMMEARSMSMVLAPIKA